MVQLTVAPLHGSDVIELPSVFSVGRFPVSQNPLLCCKDLQRWPHLRDVRLTKLPDAEVLLLTAVDVPQRHFGRYKSAEVRKASRARQELG